MRPSRPRAVASEQNRFSRSSEGRRNVTFINDLYPRAVNEDGSQKGPDDWTLVRTVIERVHIESVARFWKLLRATLEELAK